MTSPFSHFRSRFGLVLVCLGSAAVLSAQEHAWTHEELMDSRYLDFHQGRRPASVLSAKFPELLWGDMKYVFTAPLRWDREDWRDAGLLVGAVGVATLLDESVQSGTQRLSTPARDTFTQYAQRFGEEYSWAVLGGFEIVGRLTDDPRARAVAMDGVAASVISAGLITPALKKMVGRARPHTAKGAFDFSPFQNQHSFPSGHTTQAFAVATVIAEHYDEAWVKWLSYGTATAVGYSRIHQDRHFLSDVLAGALIGHLMGRTVVRRHDRLTDDEAWSWTPVATSAMTGLVLSRDF